MAEAFPNSRRRRGSQQIPKHGFQWLIRRRHRVVGKSLRANPGKLLSLLRLHQPLPLATQVERHQQMKRLIAVAGEGEGCKALWRHLNPQLLSELADQGRLGCLARLNLAARELPQSRERPSWGTLGQQHTPVGVDQRAGNDKQNVQAHAYAPAYACDVNTLAERGVKDRQNRPDDPITRTLPAFVTREVRAGATAGSWCSVGFEAVASCDNPR